MAAQANNNNKVVVIFVSFILAKGVKWFDTCFGIRQNGRRNGCSDGRYLLLHRDEEVVLLTFLGKQILAVDKVFTGDGALLVGQLLLVEADAAALYHLAHLALRGEDGCGSGEQFDGGLTKLVGSNLIVRHTVEDVEERLLVEALECFLRGLAKENVRGFDSHVQSFATVHHDGDFLAKSALQHAATGILAMLFDKGVDGLLVQRSEDLDVLFCFLVADVQPELIEAIGRRALRVEPYVALLGLSELLAIGLCDERAGQGEGFSVVAQRAADEFRASGHVAPLVVAAELELDALVLVEIEEVVALQKLVGKLGEGETVASSTVEALLYRLFCHHVVDGDVLTHFTCKVEEGEVLHPVVVVDHLGSILFLRLEVEELGHLGLDTFLVVAQGFVVQEVAFLRLAAGVANHASCSAHEDDGLVATTLQVAQHHDAAEVSYVEGIGRGIGAEVGCHHLLLQEFFRTRHDLCEHASPFQFFNKVLSHIQLYCFVCLFCLFKGKQISQGVAIPTGLWHWVVAGASPRVAAQDAPDGQTEALDGSVLHDCLPGIL